MFKQMRNPNLYHGKTPWNLFEGWYFKLTDNKNNTFAFIPGICWGKNKAEAHSFLQVLNGPKLSYNYHIYTTDEFNFNNKHFNIDVNNSSFSLDKIILNINSLQQVRGELAFSNLHTWQDSLYSPGSMGYFNFVPFLQCYSQVCVMDMFVDGELIIDGESYIFNKGKGYVEKNWGGAFPYSWIWIQSNSFTTERVALSCSIGHIPFFSSSFRGFLVGLQYKDKFIKFTTMNRSKVKINPVNKDIVLHLINKHYQLYIKTNSTPHDFILCKGPRDGKMVPLVKECLTGEVHIILRELATGRIVLEDVGEATGIEFGGDQMRILD